MILLLARCSEKENPVPETPEERPENVWIEQTMRRYYLWYDEIPAEDRLDATKEADEFFLSLLSPKDGKSDNNVHYYYSTIEKKSTDTKAFQGEGYSFGFEFQYYRITSLDKYALLVLYVLPGSPADNEGIKRGDWIMEIDNAPVPGDAASLLKALDTTTPVTVSFGVARDPRYTLTRKSVTAAAVEDNPVFLSKIINYKDRRVGYLVYNHFTAGPTDNSDDERFNNSLRECFSRLKEGNPTDFILDLRYNGGGLVLSAQLLATMLVNPGNIGDVFCRLTYNGNSNSYGAHTMYLDEKYMKQGSPGANLGLNTLYVITSRRTASASEAVINGLRPYMNVLTVGEQTEGKNVGSVTFDDSRYEWELHPIVSRLSNKDGFSDYDGGFEPDFPCSDENADAYYELGDEREYMLLVALKYMTGEIVPGTSSRSDMQTQQSLVPLYNSLDRKKSGGARLDRL
jgi:C-terminal processing protease CtpA/Prc